MKDSGIEWIGEIPRTWNVIKTKYNFTHKKIIAGVYADKFERLALTMNGVIKRSKEDSNGLQPEKFETYQVLQKDELVFKLIDLQNISTSRVGLSPYDGLVSPAYIIIKATGEILPTFAEKFFLSMWKNQIFNAMGDSGVRSSLNSKDLLDIHISVPPLAEQQTIAAYLDTKCSEIDALVADIQKQIDTLEEYKRSVITEAVTKGLDSDVEMRDSGVQWIGMIPKHWTVDNPKWHFVQRKDRATKGLTQLTASQKYGVVTQEEYMEITGAKVVTVEKDFDILKLVCPGDFIIHMRSFQGGLEYSEKYGSISSAYVMLIPQKTILEPRFYKWFFKSPVYIDALSSTSNLIRDGQAMRYANFIQLPIPLMPKEEQQQIADYLDMKCAEIDSIISEKKQQITTIEEYKKSLIFEYVTGKKEVPSQTIVIDPKLVLAAIVLEVFGSRLKGKVHFQKAMHLCENSIGTPFQTQYYRYEQGPYDKNIDTYLQILNSKQWFKIINGSPMTCTKGRNHEEFLKNYLHMFDEHKKTIKKIVDFIAPMKSSQAGRIATLFAVWNDLIIDGVTNPSDEQIINEATSNWTDNKGNFQSSTWQDSLDKMKKNGIIPKGLGIHTLKKDV